jgi:crossover junction endodeoxyribonuclease RuvC
MGIDPGLATTGYGIISNKGENLSLITYGCINTKSRKEFSQRLIKIYEGVNRLIEEFKPSIMAIEELFFCRNIKTALSVGQAKGVILLAASLRNLEIREYTPLEVKQAITGFGQAKKIQVQEMVKVLLHLREMPYPDDAADALAIAICHAHGRKLQAFRE